MTQEQLFEIIKAVGFEQSRIVNYIKEMTFKLQEIKENAQLNGNEHELHKININSGTNQFYRLTFKLGETKLLLEKYQDLFNKLTSSYNNGNFEINLSNNDIVLSACNHYINSNGIFDNSDYKVEEVKASVNMQISPYTTLFSKNFKILNYYCLDDRFMNLDNYDIDVQGIYNELDTNEDKYDKDEIIEIKTATAQLATLFARRKKAMQMEVKDVLATSDFFNQNSNIKNDNIKKQEQQNSLDNEKQNIDGNKFMINIEQLNNMKSIITHYFETIYQLNNAYKNKKEEIENYIQNKESCGEKINNQKTKELNNIIFMKDYMNLKCKECSQLINEINGCINFVNKGEDCSIKIAELNENKLLAEINNSFFINGEIRELSKEEIINKENVKLQKELFEKNQKIEVLDEYDLADYMIDYGALPQSSLNKYNYLAACQSLEKKSENGEITQKEEQNIKNILDNLFYQNNILTQTRLIESYDEIDKELELSVQQSGKSL